MDNKIKNESARDASKTKKKIIIFIIAAAVMLVLLILCTRLMSEYLYGNNENEMITVDPKKLCDTKEEGFDIFEYEEYLKYDRQIIYYDEQTGVKLSVDDDSYTQYGKSFAVIYDMVNAIMNGDADTYNSLVTEKIGHYDSFTQQQLYDIVITKKSEELHKEDEVTYTEYVFMVEYKIHENNGTYRRDIESDASRPQYIVVDDSMGKLLVTNIVYVRAAG